MRYDAKRRAAKKSLEFDLSTEYILSIAGDTCPVFGFNFSFSGNGHTVPESATLDRLDPAKGYVPGNVAVISNKANQIKSCWTPKEIYAVADWAWEQGVR